MYATNYLENAFLNSLRGVSFTPPGKIYIGLYLSNPGETGGEGVELHYEGYRRIEISFSVPAAMNGGIGVQNTSQIDFAVSPVSAGTVTHVGLSDSVTGGNMLAYGPLTESLSISQGENPVLLTGEVQFYLNGDLSNAYKTKLLNVLRGQGLTGITPYVALFNGNPDDGGSELSGDGYSRVAVTLSAPTESDSGQLICQNSERHAFGRPSTPWGAWSWSAFMDAAANGSPVFAKRQEPEKVIKAGYMPKFEPGSIRVAIN